MALFNSPAVLTETGLSGCSGSCGIGTCTPHGPATPGAPRSRRDSSVRNVQRPSQRLPPALVLLRTPGEESARPRMSTLPGEPGRMLVPARLAGFLYRSGTQTLNYRYAEQSVPTQSAPSSALGAEVPALQSRTARVCRIQAVIPLESPPSPATRARVCYRGHLIAVIVSLFSCSHKAVAFIKQRT